jgi:hypothetical protein
MYYCFHLSCCVCTHHTDHVDFHQDIVWLVLETGQSLSQMRRKIEPGVHKIFQKPRSHQMPEEWHEASSVWGVTNIWCHIQHLFAMVNLCARYLHPWLVYSLICDWVVCQSMLFYVQGLKRNAQVGDKYCYGMAAFSSNFRLFLKI